MRVQGRRGFVWKRAWRWAVSVPLAAVLLYYSLRGVEWSRIWGIIAAARWEYIVALSAITAFNLFLRSLRWRILLNAEAQLSVGLVFRANMAGYLGNNFLPARAGELVRRVKASRWHPGAIPAGPAYRWRVPLR